MSPDGVSRRSFLGAGAAAVAVAALGARRVGPPRTTTPTLVPAPTAFFVTRWGADPYARGSHSYPAVGASAAARAALAAPVGTTLFFAGEATSVDHPSTVHGALLSGRRAAGELTRVARPAARVIVVGAGIAGLAAAAHLQVQGFRVTVLEARGRLGGRIATSRVLGAPVERGALWVRGVDTNPVADIADDVGAARRTLDPARVVRYDVTGLPLGPAAVRAVQARYAQAVRAANRSRAHLVDDTALGAALAGTAPYRTATENGQHRLDYAVNTGIELPRGADVAELSLRRWDEGHPFPGGDALLVDGFDQVIEHEGRALDVRVGTPVQRIDTSRAPVTITTGGAPFTADHVIVTVPLGVLQAGAVTFTPPLPAAKQQAAASLGVGLVNHLALRFPSVFWDPRGELIDHVDTEKGRWSRWVNVAAFTGAPILLGVAAGTYARQLETQTDTTVVADAMSVLRSIYA